MNGHAITPEQITAAEAIMASRKYVGDMADKLGWVLLRECVEMGLPYVLATNALAEGNVQRDERLLKLMASVHTGIAAIAQYLDAETERRVMEANPPVVEG